MMNTDNQVDYVPDSEKEKEPALSCKNCFHGDVCYWFTQLHVLNEGMKMGETTELPFSASILATKCKKFVAKGNVEQEQ